jgi:RNA polymerase sigma-70 factor (ECF subfamily)
MVDERSLIRRAQQKDQEAFEQLVRLKRDSAYRVALNIVGDADEADDIAQQGFIRLWSALRQFNENQRFDPWFFKIIVNLAIDHLRARRRGPQPLPAEAEDEPSPGGLPPAALPASGSADAELMRLELRKVFNEIARRLTPQQRAAFTLREIEGVSTEEIARIMSTRPSTVRNHLMAARRGLQEELKRRYPEYFRTKERG